MVHGYPYKKFEICHKVVTRLFTMNKVVTRLHQGGNKVVNADDNLVTRLYSKLTTL